MDRKYNGRDLQAPPAIFSLNRDSLIGGSVVLAVDSISRVESTHIEVKSGFYEITKQFSGRMWCKLIFLQYSYKKIDLRFPWVLRNPHVFICTKIVQFSTNFKICLQQGV